MIDDERNMWETFEKVGETWAAMRIISEKWITSRDET